MKIWNAMSLASKLLLPICLALVLGLVVLAAVVRKNSADATGTLSLELGRAAATQSAHAVQLRFNAGFKIARVLASIALMAKENHSPRQALLDASISATRANPDLVGTWIEFAPNAFDGTDESVKWQPGTTGETAPAATSPIGRASLYTVNSETGPLNQPDSDGVDDTEAQEYYAGAFTSGEEYVSAPYLFPVNGADVLMTSITVPIKENGKTIGVAGVDIALGDLNKMLGEMKPLGDGSIYLVSSSGIWVAHGKEEFIGKAIADTQPAFTEWLNTAIGGKSVETSDYSKTLDTNVYRLFTPITLGDAKQPWVVIINLVADTIEKPTKAITRIILISSLALVVALSLVMILLVRGLAAVPVRRLTGVVEQLAGGNTGVEVPGTGRGDELGVMAKAIEIFRQKLIEIDALRLKTETAEREAAAARRRGMLELADGFEQSVKGVVGAVSASAVELEANAQSMASVAEEATRQVQAVAAATTEASASVTTVAAASEELSASISEISRQVSDSSRAATDAVGEVERTGITMSELAAAADEIGGIVRLIGEIASQTNLLALNATIEAARAGDAGKGFAVVASEVKNLATQTGRAAEDITGRINKIQSTTTAAVRAMNGVKDTIVRVNEISSAIAAAVEEQTAATGEISGNATQAATGTDEVARNIQGVSRAADDAGTAAAQVLEASAELAKQAEALRREVDSFIARVRAE